LTILSDKDKEEIHKQYPGYYPRHDQKIRASHAFDYLISLKTGRSPFEKLINLSDEDKKEIYKMFPNYYPRHDGLIKAAHALAFLTLKKSKETPINMKKRRNQK